MTEMSVDDVVRAIESGEMADEEFALLPVETQERVEEILG